MKTFIQKILRHKSLIKTILKITFILTTLIILYGTTTKIKMKEIEIEHVDKLAHALAFFILYFLFDFGFHKSISHIIKFLSLFLFGVAIECIQYYLPYRSFSLADILANSTGLCVYYFWQPYMRKLEKENSPL